MRPDRAAARTSAWVRAGKWPASLFIAAALTLMGCGKKAERLSEPPPDVMRGIDIGLTTDSYNVVTTDSLEQDGKMWRRTITRRYFVTEWVDWEGRKLRRDTSEIRPAYDRTERIR